MSSTHRGAKRRTADFYPTPPWCTARLLEAVEFPAGRWLEPAAGRGHIIDAVSARRTDIEWHACELRRECRPRLERFTANIRCPSDFLAERLDQHFDVVISNPPFSLAREFLERSLDVGDWVAMFLRLNFLGSATRNALFRNNMPDVYVLPDRPSFTNDGKTDSIEYAWFVWGPDERERERGRIVVLPGTPLRERRRRDPGEGG